MKNKGKWCKIKLTNSRVGDEMKRIWNALRYGDFETRKCIGSVLAFSVASVGFIIASGILGTFYLFIIGLLFAVAAIIFSQTFTLVDDDFVAEVNRDGDKDMVRTVSVVKNGVSSKTMSEDPKNEVQSGKEEKNLRNGENYKDSQREEPSADLGKYNAEILKKVKKKHHVKKDHRPIIIDSSKSFHIKECPAFIWRVHNKVFLLLLEKEPRRICIPRELIRHMDYVPGVRADRSKEYPAFQKENLVTTVFEGYLPDYYEEKTNPALKYKNLYQIYPDIQLSNRSAAQVMDLLCLNFMPENKITRSDKLNGYFKRIYSANILLKDKVYSITEYKDEVEKVLKELCYAEMPEREFVVTLENLVKGRLISKEYADHYTEFKKKISK